MKGNNEIEKPQHTLCVCGIKTVCCDILAKYLYPARNILYSNTFKCNFMHPLLLSLAFVKIKSLL